MADEQYEIEWATGPLTAPSPATPKDLGFDIEWGPTPPTTLAPGLLSALSAAVSGPLKKAFSAAGTLDVKAGLKTPEQAESRATTYTGMVAPQTGVDWALLGAGPLGRGIGAAITKSPIGQRLVGAGANILAGEGEGQAERGEPVSGALQGAGASVAGALPAAGGFLWRATPWGRRQVIEGMTREVLEDVGKISPTLKGLTKAQVYKEAVVFPRTLQAKFGQEFEAGIARASALAPGPVVASQHLTHVWEKLPKKSPADLQIWSQLAPNPTSGKFTIEQAQELLQKARAGAYRGPRLLTEKATTQSARVTYEAARKEVYASLPKAAAAELEQTRILHGVNKGLAAVFKEGGALQPGPLGPTLDPNKALTYMEKAGDALRTRMGDDSYRVLHAALSRGGELGERHDLGTKELVPGILERSVVIARSVLKHIGVNPITLGGTRRQPFTPPVGAEIATGILGGQAGARALGR